MSVVKQNECSNCNLLEKKIEERTSERDEARVKLEEYEKKGACCDISQIVIGLKEVKLEVGEVLGKAAHLEDTLKRFQDNTDENFIVVKDIIKDTQRSVHVMGSKVDKIEEGTKFKARPFQASMENISVDHEVEQFDVKDDQSEVKDAIARNVIYKVAPDSSGILVAGDYILDSIPIYMVDFLYDLLGQATFKTSQAARVREFFVGGTKGVKLVTEESKKLKLIVLSFGRNDLLEDSDFIREKDVSEDMDRKVILEINLGVAKRVSDNIQAILKKIASYFSEVDIVYLLPAPSQLNSSTSQIFEVLRNGIRDMEGVPSNLVLFDMENVVKDIDYKGHEECEGPGTLNWRATRKVIRELYKTNIGQEFKGVFCDECYGCHRKEACPTLEMKSLGYATEGRCHICYEKGHKARDCFMWEALKDVESCPHCGMRTFARKRNLNHNPDLCNSRFAWCRVCRARGHDTKVHEDPDALRSVRERIGNCILVDKTIAKSVDSNKRPANKSKNEPFAKASKEND